MVSIFICPLKMRKDDIPKLNKREKSWYCERCGALMFAEKRPLCVKPTLDAARAAAHQDEPLTEG